MSMHMGHVALRVRDVGRASEHAQRTLGLVEKWRDDGTALLSANEKHHELQFVRGDRAGLDHVGLELESPEAMDALSGRVAASGARVLGRAEERGLADAFRFVGPGGVVYEAYSTMERRALDVNRYLRPAVRRFGHLTFHCEAHDAMVAFWVNVLGFRVSDTAEGLTWVRCDANHHGLAVANVPGAYRLHHHAWEIQDVAALTKYCDEIAALGHTLLWGPVRHGPGFNIATYMADPDGAVTEVYADMLRIDDDAAYVPVDWSDEPRALNLWGPGPSEDLLTAGTPILPPLEEERQQRRDCRRAHVRRS